MPFDLATSLYRHLLSRLPAGRAYTRADLHAGALPGPVASLLDRTLDRWVEYERAQRRSDWFDYEDPAVRAAGDRYFEALSRTARIPASAWAESLEGAVRLVVRHLVTPVRALTDAVFQGDPDPLPADVVRERLTLFDAYPYFVEIAGAYLERKRAEALDPDGLFDLLARIDRRVTAGFGAEEWLDLLKPLFALARHLPEQAGVPAPLLARFFEAKGASAVANHLRRREDALDESALRAVLVGELGEDDQEDEEPARDERQLIGDGDEPEPDAIAEALEESEPEHDDISREHDVFEAEHDNVDAEHDAEAAEQEPLEAASEPEPAGEPELADDEIEATAGESDAPAELIPLWQRFAGPDAEPEDEEDEPETVTDGPVPLWQRFASSTRQAEASAHTPAPPPSRPAPSAAPSTPPGASPASLDELERRVLGVTPPERRQQYIRHLTGGSEADYEAVLRALDRAGSWTEAAQVIAQHIFRRHRVDIYSEYAVEFTDTVEARFRRLR